MAYFDNLYSGTISKLGQAKNVALGGIKRGFENVQAEGERGLGVAAQRGGYAGSPVEAALKRKFAANLAGQQGQAVAGLESNYLTQLGTLEGQQAQASAQERMQRDIANQQMWGNIIGGAGSLLGGVSNMLGWGKVLEPGQTIKTPFN